MRISIRILILLMLFLLMNVIGFIILPTLGYEFSGGMFRSNYLLIFKTIVMMICVWYIVYSSVDEKSDMILIMFLSLLLYLPIFFGVDEKGFRSAWPIGFFIIDCFALFGMRAAWQILQKKYLNP